jgi:hypothetical protein
MFIINDRKNKNMVDINIVERTIIAGRVWFGVIATK